MSKQILSTAGYPGELALIVTNFRCRKPTVCVTGPKLPDESLMLEIMTEAIIILNTF
jgi:hypothetical protein